MLKVALKDNNGIRTDWGSAVAHGKLVMCGETTQYVVACPDLLEDHVRGDRLCQASVRQLMQSLNTAPLNDVVQTHILKSIVEQVITSGWQILQKENALGTVQLVVVLVRGNRIAVGSSADMTAFFSRNTKLFQLQGKILDPVKIGFNGLPCGHVIEAKTSHQEVFFAVVPGTFQLPENQELNQLLKRGGSLKDNLRQLVNVMPSDNEKPNQLILGFTRSERAAKGNGAWQRENEKSDAGTLAICNEVLSATTPIGKQLSVIEEILKNLADRFDKLPTELPTDDRPWETLLDRLNKYEQQETDRHFILPLLHRLILIYDLITSGDQRVSENILSAVQDELLETLSMHEVERYSTPGPHFDFKLQKCIGKQKAPTSSGDGIVAEKVRDGFRRGEQILRFEEVTVYRYEQPTFL